MSVIGTRLCRHCSMCAACAPFKNSPGTYATCCKQHAATAPELNHPLDQRPSNPSYQVQIPQAPYNWPVTTRPSQIVDRSIPGNEEVLEP